jgi:hypothetical protein
MIAASSRPDAWPQRRWVIIVLLVFIAQVALIFSLSEKPRPRARSYVSSPMLRLTTPGTNEVLSLLDPTWFALPHWHGFSGPAWMKTPGVPLRAFSWSEDLRPLALPALDLGSAFNRFVATNDFAASQVLAPPEPIFNLPAVYPLQIASRSSLRIEGGLAQRRLLTPLALPLWSHTELLSNSVVQLLVDADGRPVSAGTLLVSSGHPPADQHALQQAISARFDALRENNQARPTDRLTWGTLIFEWKNVQAPATNAAPAGRPSSP